MGPRVQHVPPHAPYLFRWALDLQVERNVDSIEITTLGDCCGPADAFHADRYRGLEVRIGSRPPDLAVPNSDALNPLCTAPITLPQASAGCGHAAGLGLNRGLP